MGIYAYQPRFRLVPEDGPQRLYDLTALTEARGPVRTDVRYEPEKVRRQSVNRKLIEKRFGLRPVCRMGFEIATLAEESWLADIVSSSMRDDVRVYLSLNAGVSEREVYMIGDYARPPLAGKALAGIATDLEFRAVDLVDGVPRAVIPGAAQVAPQLFLDTGIETSWISPTALNGPWFGENGTANRDAAVFHGGTYSARIDQPSGGTSSAQIYQVVGGLVANQLYEIRYFARVTGFSGAAGEIGLYVNRTGNDYLQDNGTWTANANHIEHYLTVANFWTEFVLQFIDPTPAANHQFIFRGVDGGNISIFNQSVYWDDFSLKAVLPATQDVANW